jgi:pre-rRNA-processing protein TSR1
VPKDVSWRENRAYIVNEGPLEFEDGTEEGGEGKGTLVVSGFVRGGKLSADRLVHIQNYGDFQIDKVGF